MLSTNVKNNLSDVREYFTSMKRRKVLIALGLILAAVLIFHAGMVVGSHRRFHGKGEGRYGFHPMPGLSQVQMPHGFLQNGHGVVGVVEKVDKAEITVLLRDSSTSSVLVGDGTAVRSGRDHKTQDDIQAGQSVIVLGEPNDDGTISAHFINILPRGVPLPTK